MRINQFLTAVNLQRDLDQLFDGAERKIIQARDCRRRCRDGA